MATNAPTHGPVTDRQGRLTYTLIDDRSNLQLSLTTTSPLTGVSRLESVDIDNATKVDPVIEVGTNGIVGGVVNLGEFHGKFNRQATSVKLLELLTAKKRGGYATTAATVGSAVITIAGGVTAASIGIGGAGVSITCEPNTAQAETVLTTAASAGTFTCTFGKTHAAGWQFLVGGQTVTWNYFDLANAQFDYTRIIADPKGNVYAFWAAIDGLVAKLNVAAKSTGTTMESWDVMGPQLVYANGYPVSKNYIVLAGDVTNNSIPVSSTFFGALNSATAGAEIPVRVNPPASGQPPNSLYSSGRANMLKIARISALAQTIGGVSYSAGSYVRYRENQDYKVTNASLGTAGAQALVQATVTGVGNYLGPEITVGSTIIVDVGAATAVVENCVVTAITGSTLSFTTTHIHATTGITIALAPTSGRCVYNPLNGFIVAGDVAALGDVWHVLFSSYDTSSSPKTIGTTTLDTVDVAGIPGRLTPVTIGAFGVPRVQTATIDVTVPRKQVQGAGEDEVIYGTAGVPDIGYSLDVIPVDNSIIEQFSAGATGNGTAGDIYTMDYIARYQNTNASPFVISIKHPITNAKVIMTYTGAQPVFGTQAESGTSSSELTQKYSGKDLAGSIVISATT
jgi:hypothetical protein